MTTTTKTSKSGAIKGTAAAAAGVAVLLGGAGTFALWNADLEVGNADKVTAGELKVAEYTAGSWTDANKGDAVIDSIADFRMVPGDTLVREDSASVIAYGDNLVIEADITNQATIASEFGGDVTVDVEVDPSTLNTDTQTPQTLPVTVTVSYAKDGTSGNDGQTAEVDLSTIEVALTQLS
jgi:alternate signal-mediated exported protein